MGEHGRVKERGKGGGGWEGIKNKYNLLLIYLSNTTTYIITFIYLLY
nr:MAG TPA: hypothetical protein [Caudoviricetes sp.]